MIFADKLIRLRKKNGWSQEELADKMNVSRQAVSKWESAQTIPDLGKVLMLSQLFGVTTDYLLKDELEAEEFTGEDTAFSEKRVTLEQANAYLTQRRAASFRIALATFLCILSPIPLILLGAMSEYSALSENLAGGMGLILLLLLVAAAVAIYIYTGFQNAPYTFLETEPFETEYGVKGMVRERQKAFHGTYARANILATCLCVLSPVPIFIALITDSELFMIGAVTVTIFLVGIGVAFFIIAGVQWASMQKLLKEGEFSDREKQKSKITSPVSTVYWLLATAVYLGISFTTGRWDASWIVWPVAGVLFAAVITVCRLLAGKKLEEKG